MRGKLDCPAMKAAADRVLVTGATGGIGQAIARAFAASGAELVLSGRREDVLVPLARELEAQSAVADLADRADLNRLIADAGAVDVLVANAALPGSGLLVDLAQAQIDATLEVNLAAPIALARALLPGMLERGHGHLVFISSLAGKAASPAASLYNATKFGLRGFALGVREDLHGSGVSASVVLPGFISDAGMFHDSGVTLPRGVGTRTPDQVATAVLTAVREDRAEVTVAPLGLRLGSELAQLAPAFGARAQRRLGGGRVARRLAGAQAPKRPPA
jgi:short-subunit dehydrogenase